MNIDNFIGIFPGAVNDNICDLAIEHFEKAKELNFVRNRKETDQAPKLMKDTKSYFLSGTSDLVDYKNEILAKNDRGIFETFSQSLWNCYQQYVDHYGVLETVGKHGISGTIKIQKTSPGEGYHAWHCEHDGFIQGNRLMMAILFLNNVEEGGETEFLYQSKRIKPRKGTILLCPSSFTHTHRGNPPISGDKYILTTWIEYYQ